MLLTNGYRQISSWLAIVEEILTELAIYRRNERLKQMSKGQAVREVGGGEATLGEAII